MTLPKETRCELLHLEEGQPAHGVLCPGPDTVSFAPLSFPLAPQPAETGTSKECPGIGEHEPQINFCFLTHKECADPENHKVRQKLKAKEWDEFLAKGKRFRVLQPVKIGCVWAADRDCAGDDLKVLQQFAACFLETVPVQEEQTPKASKASKRENRDQQSECGWGFRQGLPFSGAWPGHPPVPGPS